MSTHADPSPRIEDLALLSDCSRAALVSSDLDVVWLSSPRFDSPTVFGSLLGARGGRFGLEVHGRCSVTRSYVADTLVLRTEVESDTGRIAVTDALATGPNPDGHDLGRWPPGLFVRNLECLEGHVDVTLHFEPRPEYGVVSPLLLLEPGAVRARGGPSRVLLSCPWPTQIRNGAAVATRRLQRGEQVAFGVQVARLGDPAPEPRSQADLAELLKESIEAWQTWSMGHQGYQGVHRDMVHLSGRVLYALTYRPTGAVIAAPTTSLPEEIGGSRNWDYRFTWLRDASWTMSAMSVAGCPDEATEFFDFLTWSAGSAVHDNGYVQVMFGVGGEHDLSERELPHLDGYEGSSPVRVGNGAWDQKQLDVYGELLDAAHRLREHLVDPEPHVTSFLAAMADAALAHWEESDNGIWEVRGPARRFLHSTLMCWVALDRACRLADLLGCSDALPRWRAGAEAIRETILARGWNERLGSFTQYLDGETLDAAALMIPLVGFLPNDDPRVLSTI